MKFPKYLTDEQVEQLKYEVLSQDFYIFLTRFLVDWCENTDDMVEKLMRENKLINLSRTVSGGKIYVLESDDWGIYENAEYAWHDSNIFLIFRGLSTVEFIEYTCELLKLGYFEIDFINKALKKENASFRFHKDYNNHIHVKVLTIEEIESSIIEGQNVNIRLLFKRMENSFKADDYSNVLHASASIFETMAKDIIGIPTIQDKTLKSFFERYRVDSKLPSAILDYILNTYEKRNITPLAGHGSLTIPNISKEDAIILIEMTQAFVRIEYRMQRES